MGKYILKRLGQTVLIVIIVSIATFFLVNLIPGDIVYTVAGTEELEQDEYDAIYHELNLDKTQVERFFIWAKGAIRGDFGKSYVYSKPVMELIKDKIPTTMYLSVLATIVSVPIGILFGIISAVNRKKPSDTVITLTANICHCLPQFWVAVLLMWIFCVKLQLLPSMGFGWPSKIGWGKHISRIILPVICMSLGSIAGFTRQTRSSMLEVIRQDYIRTAKSKGLSEKEVRYKHLLKNGLIPILTLLGGRISGMIGGSMIIENVFSIPGMGTMSKTCIMSKDIPTIQAIVMITTIFSCLAYLLTDIAYVMVDPRISLTESGD